MEESTQAKTMTLSRTFAIFVLCTLLTAMGMIKFLLPPALTYIVESYDRKFSPWDVHLEGVDIHLNRGALTIESVEIMDPVTNGSSSISKLVLDISPWGLLKGEFVIDNVGWVEATIPLELGEQNKVSFLGQPFGQKEESLSKSSVELPFSLNFNSNLGTTKLLIT